MSTAAIDAGAAPAAKGNKKKLIMIVAGVVVLLAVAGGAAMMMMSKKAHAEDGEEGEAPAAHAKAPEAKGGHRVPPTFVALEPFTVNLADKDMERYAQVGVTLEVDDAKFAEEMKAYMPSIRNNILLILAHKTSTELLERAGKDALAAEIMRESVRPLGIEIDDDAAADEDPAPKKKKKKKVEVHNPVTRVNFSNFIIQ